MRPPASVLAYVMAGGEGSRLGMLAERRAKPAVPFAGAYRLIDFTLSNCARSGVSQVGVLTQYEPHALHHHLGTGAPWGFGRRNFEVLQPYLSRHEPTNWYRGTADAVFQNLLRRRDAAYDAVLVLAGDHVYVMDYRELLDSHRANDADVTLGVVQVPLSDASRFGLVHTDGQGRVQRFDEKPSDPATDLASMGIYAFRPEYLAELLAADARDPDSSHDFGNDVIPRALAGGARVFVHAFDGYWRDVGTVEAYWDAHVEFLLDAPLALQAVTTRAEALPPAQVSRQGYLHDSMVAPGTVVHGHVERSVLSPGVVIGPGAVVRDSIVLHGARIGSGAYLERTIVDEGAEIGERARLGLGGTDTVASGRSDLLVNGLNVVGERARVPPYFTVFRNTMIGAHVDHLTRGGSLPAGGTVLARSSAVQRAPLLAS